MWENSKEAEEALDKANRENTIVCPYCGLLDQVEIFGADAMVCHTCEKKVYETIGAANKRIAELEAEVARLENVIQNTDIDWNKE